MPDSPSKRLPDRPSIEQLRKQARDLVRAWREGNPEAAQRLRVHKPNTTEPLLADAQYAVAREYGFDSWPRLVHHIEALNSRELQRFQSMARDMVDAYAGDTAALARLNEQFSDNKSPNQFRAFVRQQSRPVGDRGDDDTFTLDDARFLLAAKLGFQGWNSLVATLTQPEVDPRSAPRGLSIRPPFYRIDWSTNTLEPRQPFAVEDWDVIIDVMREHGITSLNANGQMTAEALKRVSKLSQLTALNFGGTKRMTDEGMAHLANMPQLEDLDLSDYPGGRINDAGLEVLRHLPELKRFAMCWQRGISDGGVANLSFCDKLEEVNLLGSPTGDGAINALRGKRHLRLFRTGRLVTDAGLPLLRDFPVFKTWQGGEPRYGLMSFGDSEPNFLMVDGPFGDQGFAGLAGLEGLFGLGFFRHVTNLTSNALQFIVDLPHLGALGCEGNLCDDTAMRHIASIPNLRMLMAQGTVASDDGFRALSKSRSIEHIWGRECPNLTGPGFAALADMPSLVGLGVSCARVDDGSLAALPTFPKLQWLMPMDVPDAGFRHVGKIERLEKLTCMYCRDTGDAATGHLTPLTNLKHYYAGQTQITDRSLKILGGITSLEEVQLSACKFISDAGLIHIARLPRLRLVSVDATARVTRAAIGVFPANVRVDFWT